MLRLLIPVLFLASVQGIAYTPPHRLSAASPAQIRFAYENKFDDTGPGAKEPEAAYHVYKNLDDALLAYVDDPDTQLPQHEKARAIANLYRSNKYYDPPRKYTSFGNRPKVLPLILNSYSKFRFSDHFGFPHTGQELIGEISRATPKWHNDPPAKRLNLASDFNDFSYQYKPHPEVEFSYDVHDKETGDSKNVQELQDGSGTVHGYFTISENDGRSRTVTYEGDRQKGYRSIQRVF